MENEMGIQHQARGLWPVDRLAIAGAILILFTSAALPASAAGTGYVGTRIGFGNAGRDRNIGTEAEGSVGELFGGIRLDEHWAIELGLFGTDLDVGDLPFFPDTTIDNRVRMRGAALSARYDMPLSRRASIHLRGGLANFDLDYRARFNFPSESGVPDSAIGLFELDGNSMGSVLAVGVDTSISERWRVGVELQHYRGNLRTDDDDIFDGFTRAGSLQTAMLSLSSEF
jgi:hypothetical protein